MSPYFLYLEYLNTIIMAFEIDAAFKDELRYVEARDTRSEEEILASIRKPHVSADSSEKNIWAFWHSGLDDMPGWTRRNVVDWARLCGPSWTIRVLDTVPGSPNNALNYVPAELLPETFVKGTMTGDYVGPHSADFLRGALLYLYGGVFMDVGNILVRNLDDMCWNILADPQSPRQISVPWMYDTIMANNFVAARKSDPFIKRWHDLFVHLWKDRDTYQGMASNPLVSFALIKDFSKSAARGFAWEFKIEPIVVFEYIMQVVAWDRLCMLEDAGDGFSGADYARDNILWFDSLEEEWAAEKIVGFKGQDLFDALATRLDDDPNSERYKKAHEMTWRILTKSSVQKVTRGKNLTKTPALGLLWDLPENQGKDFEKGTFAELLRYGSVHFEQTRPKIAVVQTEKPKETMRKGVLEP